jgi:hypothetical protein
MVEDEIVLAIGADRPAEVITKRMTLTGGGRGRVRAEIRFHNGSRFHSPKESLAKIDDTLKTPRAQRVLAFSSVHLCSNCVQFQQVESDCDSLR